MSDEDNAEEMSEKGGRPSIGQHLSAVLSDALKYGLASTLSRLSGLLTLPLLTRVLTVSEYGTIDVVLVFIALLSTLTKLGVPPALARFFKSSEAQDVQAEMVSSLMILVAVTGLLCVAIGGFFTRPLAEMLLGSVEQHSVIQLGWWLILLMVLEAIPEMVLRLERRIMAFNLVNLIFAILYVGLLFFLLLDRDAGVRGVFIAYLWARGTALGVSLIFIRNHLRPRFSVALMVKALRFGLPLTPGTLAVRINAQVDRMLLLYFLGLGGIAFFGAASRIARIGGFLFGLFTAAWKPYAMLLLESPDRNAVYHRVLNFFIVVSSILGLSLTAISPELLALLAPVEYHHGYIVIPWLVGAGLLHRASHFTNLGILVSKRTAAISIAFIVGVLLNASLGWVLIRSFGFLGAAIASFVGEMAAFGLLWFFSEAWSDIRFDRATVLSVVSYYTLAAIALLSITASFEGWISAILRAAVLGLATLLMARTGLTVNVSEIFIALRDKGQATNLPSKSQSKSK